MKETQTFLHTDELESFLEYMLPEASNVQVDQLLMQQEELILTLLQFCGSSATSVLQSSSDQDALA